MPLRGRPCRRPVVGRKDDVSAGLHRNDKRESRFNARRASSRRAFALNGTSTTSRRVAFPIIGLSGDFVATQGRVICDQEFGSKVITRGPLGRTTIAAHGRVGVDNLHPFPRTFQWTSPFGVRVLGLRHRQHAAPGDVFSSAQFTPGVGTFVGHRWGHPWPKSATTSATTGDFAMARDKDLTGMALRDRRARLETLLAPDPGCLQLISQTPDVDEAEDWLRLLPSIEGVVAKRADGRYLSGQRDWVKVNHHRTADCVVIGIAGDGRTPWLVLGLRHSDLQLRHVGLARPSASVLTPEFAAVLAEAGLKRIHPLALAACRGPVCACDACLGFS